MCDKCTGVPSPGIHIAGSSPLETHKTPVLFLTKQESNHSPQSQEFLVTVKPGALEPAARMKGQRRGEGKGQERLSAAAARGGCGTPTTRGRESQRRNAGGPAGGEAGTDPGLGGHVNPGTRLGIHLVFPPLPLSLDLLPPFVYSS